jgi:proton-coupled amino acid transporter
MEEGTTGTVQAAPVGTPPVELESKLLDMSEHHGGELYHSPETFEVANDDEEEMEDGELARRKFVPDTPLHLGAFHIFKGNVGVGVFLLPMVYNDMGYILSPMIAIPIGIVVTDCMLMLLRSKLAISRSKVQTYPEVAEFVFGSIMRVVVNAAIVMTQFGFCLMYLQGAATIFSELVDFDGSYKVFVFLQLFLVMPLCFLSHNLKVLAVSSATATFLVWFCVIGTMVFFGKQLSGDDGIARTTTATGSVSKWALFVASNLAVLEGINIVLPVENAVSKADKPRVPSMVHGTMSAIVALYAVYGTLGYLAYGCALKNTSVTALPINAIGDALRIGLAFNLLLTYPLQFVPAIQIVDKALGIPANRTGGKSKKAVLTRVGINILIMALAMLIGGDTLSLIVSFIGATAAVFLAMILPALLGLHTAYAVEHDGPREGAAYYKAICTLYPRPAFRLKCLLYVVLGLAIFGVATATCLIDTASLVNRKNHREGQTPPTSNSTSTVSCDL